MLEQEDRSASGIIKDEPLSAWLDLFRWVAAFAVVLTHMNAIYYVKVMTLPMGQRSLGHLALAVLSGWGRPAVMMFFVLSGYLVGGGSWRKYQRFGRFAPGDYMVARLSRLWLVVLPGLVMISGLFLLGTGPFGGISSGAYAPHTDEAASAQISFGVFICNAFFMQTALCPNFAGDGALWSLFNEFWYYCAWCIFMVALASSRPTLRFGLPLISLATLLGLAILQIRWAGRLRDDILIYSSVWLLGVAVAANSKRVPALNPALAAILFAACLTIWRVYLSPPDIGDRFGLELSGDTLVAFSFAHLLFAMQRSRKLSAPPFAHLHVGLAAFSFSLYVLHEPILISYNAALRRYVGVGYVIVPRTLSDYAVGFSAISLCVLVAFVFGHYTERYTVNVRNAIIYGFGKFFPLIAEKDEPVRRDGTANQQGKSK